MQDCSISSALAVEILQSYSKPFFLKAERLYGLEQDCIISSGDITYPLALSHRFHINRRYTNTITYFYSKIISIQDHGSWDLLLNHTRGVYVYANMMPMCRRSGPHFVTDVGSSNYSKYPQSKMVGTTLRIGEFHMLWKFDWYSYMLVAFISCVRCQIKKNWYHIIKLHVYEKNLIYLKCTHDLFRLDIWNSHHWWWNCHYGHWHEKSYNP